jgi:hypothetical protein
MLLKEGPYATAEEKYTKKVAAARIERIPEGSSDVPV